MIDDVITAYSEELNGDTEVTPITVRDKQMKLPSIKHKWTARLIRAKRTVNEKTRAREGVIQDFINKAASVARITKTDDAILRKQAYKTEAVISLTQEIEDTEILIEYLEKVEKILSTMTYDIKNLIELMKMEIS